MKGSPRKIGSFERSGNVRLLHQKEKRKIGRKKIEDDGGDGGQDRASGGEVVAREEVEVEEGDGAAIETGGEGRNPEKGGDVTSAKELIEKAEIEKLMQTTNQFQDL